MGEPFFMILPSIQMGSGTFSASKWKVSFREASAKNMNTCTKNIPTSLPHGVYHSSGFQLYIQFKMYETKCMYNIDMSMWLLGRFLTKRWKLTIDSIDSSHETSGQTGSQWPASCSNSPTRSFKELLAKATLGIGLAPVTTVSKLTWIASLKAAKT